MYTNNVRNPRTCTTPVLTTEESRLLTLRVMKGNRARAQKSLANVQRELQQRDEEPYCEDCCTSQSQPHLKHCINYGD